MSAADLVRGQCWVCGYVRLTRPLRTLLFWMRRPVCTTCLPLRQSNTSRP